MRNCLKTLLTNYLNIRKAYHNETWWTEGGVAAYELIRFWAQNMLIKYLICIP